MENRLSDQDLMKLKEAAEAKWKINDVQGKPLENAESFRLVS